MGQGIAIIGISGRYPMARNLKVFWENLKAGRDCIREIPEDRWNWQNYYQFAPDKEGPALCKWGGFIDDVDKFDPLLFGISPAEAENMDPQERLMLETAWLTLEDAGYTAKSIEPRDRNVGVFIGIMNANYEWLAAEACARGSMNGAHSYYWSAANRISYSFDFHGPSLAVDTACSSSLTAIHLACESLRHGECRVALAGGVNVILHPMHYVRLAGVNMLSKDGKCRPFGDGGNGIVCGEGVGAVLLKPLREAIKDGDHIYAVIAGTAVNAGGKTSGYTVPNPNAQAEVVSRALRRAGINPVEISYVEAHGTGTVLGDPIEIAGLKAAYASAGVKQQFCAIGSVKGNIGHLESA